MTPSCSMGTLNFRAAITVSPVEPDRDTLDYSNYSECVYVDLLDGEATGIKNGISSIENVIGSDSGNEIYGNNLVNHLVGTSGDDEIYRSRRE